MLLLRCVVVVRLNWNRWFVLGFVIVPMLTLTPFLLVAPGLEWARRGVSTVLHDLTINPRVSLPPQ